MSDDLARFSKFFLIVFSGKSSIIGNTCQVAIAIILSRLGNIFKRVFQSIIFLSYFVSYVIVATFSYALFNSGTGVITSLVRSMGNPAFAPYSDPGMWKYIIVLTYLWKSLGYGTVIYLAAITGISDEYYEAAEVDGATVIQQIRYINILAYPFIAFITVLFLIPFWLIIAASVTDNSIIMQRGFQFIPSRLSLTAFRYIFAAPRSIT